MHEASIAQAILEQALTAVPAGNANITKITLAAGPFAQIESQSLEFYFDHLKKNTPAHNASLEVKQSSAHVECTKCSFKEEYIPPGELKTKCPICSSQNKLVGSDEVYIESVEIEEDEPID